MQTNGYIKERMIAAAQNITEKDYWINKLSGRPIKTTFPYDHMRSVQGDDQMDRVIFSIKNDLFSRLMKISNQSDVRLYTILVTALTLLLEKYTENEDIIVGIPTYKQKVEGIPINTILPLRNHVNPEQTFKELLLQVGQTIFDANQHQNYPIEILIYKLGMHFDGHHCPLFDIAILFEGLHNREYLGPFYLNTIFSFSSVQGAIKGLLEYNTRYYKKETIEQIIEHFTHLLKEALFNVDAATSSISLLSEEEKRHLIVDFNNTRHEFSIRQSIYHLIEEYAESKPDLNALIFEGSSWTYHHLNEESNKLAWTLKNRGVRENQTVGILLERSPWMVASILAVWKSNGAYIPIDTRYPVARTVDILEDACACVLITCADYLEPQLEKSFKGAVVQLDVAQPEAISVSVTSENLNLLFNINSLAYVIFTSGSTGKPKGAMVEHIGMMNHIQAKINDLQLTENSVVAQNASHTFDISVWQLFAGLAVGGKIVIYPNELILEPGQFFTRLIEDHVTILEVVPSYLSVMLDVIEDRGGGLAIDFPLDYLLVTGEEIKLFLVRKWFSIYPGIKMVNAYGPTEASDDITHFIMDKAPTGERIPIGKPLQNLNIYIVDRRMNLCPVGVPGEILVSGVGVGRGYIGDSARTAEVFTVDPFRQEEGGRLYKTGDIGRWLPDGNIEFLGRKDYQVKIRGFRIELGEIENQLVRHPLVKDAIVVERSKENNDKYLCAYIVKDTHPGATVNEHELREMLSFELPDYMIPDYFIELERFPLTPTGKCDRAALPEPCRTGLADIPYISDERLNQLKNQLEKESTGSKGGAEAHLDDAVHQAEVLKKFSNESGVLYYPLSHPQKMIYYSEKKYPNTGNANAVYLVRYSKILDQELLQKAVNIVLFKNQNLRLRVMEIEKDDDFFPAQYVAPYKEHALEKFDFSYERNQVLSTQLKEWVEKCSAKPFKLIDSDLFYFAYLIFNKKESGYFMNIHHVITDQWSCFLISVEINKIYHALESGREIGDSQVVSYFQYLRDEMDYLNSPRAAEDRKFWLNYLLPLPTEVNLSPIQSDGDRNDLEAKVHYSVFPFDLRSRMHRYCREHKTTLYKLILSALSIYISRTAGVNDFVVGTLNHNRSTPVHKEIVGTFISFVPIRVKVSQEKIFQDFVKEKGESINYVIKNHQRYPFDMLVAEIRERTAGDVDYFFNINLIGHPDLEEKDFKIKRLFQGYEMTPLTIHVNRSNKDIDGILELEWIFQVAKFSENDMKRIHNGLVNILENALNEPNKKISKLEMVSDREKKFILEDLGCREHSLPMHIIQSVMPELNEGRCFYTYILSPEGMVQPPGVPGELCLAFIDVEHRSTGNIRRTGQLARWLENEKIELLGDIHRQIWVDGRRLDAGRIESCLLSHKNVTQTVVVSRGGMGNKQLCAYIVLNGPVGKSRLVEYLTEKLPKHLIPEDIVQLQCFPLRSNGTIDIELLESLTIDTVFSKGIRPPRNETEWKMVDIWSWLLGIEKEQIGIGDNFFEIGGHSLKAIQLVTKIHKELNVRIPMAKIFEFPTIESLAEHIREIENEKFTAIEPAEKKNYYRLSSAQKRFYFLRQVDKTGTSYNMPRVITVEGELDRQWITDTFKLMIQRHESLRTSFHLVDENIFQRVHDEVEFEPEYFDLEAVGGDSISEQEVAAGIIQKFIKPFELSRAPLMRVGFVKVKEKRHLLMLDTHHIISDGVSTAIFLKEFKAFYSGEYLQPLRIQYRDYAEWQHNEKKKEEFMKQEAFWCSQFKGNIPVLNLPTDYRRPSEQNFEGKHVDFEIGMNETQAFNRLVLQEDVTLFMLFLAIYNVLLLKLSGQEDIVVGAPIAGRSHADLEQIIGIFVNTLVLRNFPSGEKTFIEFLHEVKEKTLSAFENQDYQYEDLVDQVVISRDANRNPLFDTMFVLQNIDIAEINIPGLKLKPYQYKNEVSK
ncbi:MAG TPA: amino acid adenylation domain-containing protein, partial [Candidatus Deferrimicrobium sp.]|nr:amino acid adenylation domain-containing protein [Candidatus Deferrimicrobium sp.]